MIRRRLLIDVSGLAYRAAYKLSLSHKGRKTNVVYGVLKSLEKLADKLQPEEMILCYDDQYGTLARKEIYPDYKANRHENPKHEEKREEVASQLPVLREIMNHLPVVQLAMKGMEADDVIAVLSKFLHLEKVGIVTKDADLYQLASPPRCVVYDYEGRKVKLEMMPSQYITYKVLVGDPSDNIKGVTQIGPVKARKLIKEHKTLKAIMAYADEAGGLGTMSYPEAMTVVRRNLRLIKLGELVTDEAKAALLNNYKHARLCRVTNKKALRQELMGVGFSSFVAGLSRLTSTFGCMIRDTRVGKDHEAGAVRQDSSKRGERGQIPDSKERGERYAKIVCNVVRASAKEHDRIRQEAPVGLASQRQRGRHAGALRPGNGKGAEGDNDRRTMERWRKRAMLVNKRIRQTPEVQQRRSTRRGRALSLLQPLQEDRGWEWLKQQPSERLRFISTLIGALEDNPTYAPRPKDIGELEELHYDYSMEMPSWMKTAGEKAGWAKIRKVRHVIQ